MNSTVSRPLDMQQSAPVRENIYDITDTQLLSRLAEWGEPAYRSAQIMRWLYKEFASDFAQMTNLPVALREKLAGAYNIGSAALVAQKISGDGWTRKVLLKLRDGNTIEAVLMLYYDRATVCISSQVGCAMGCTFCATGQMGFTRNLSAGEIVEQVIWFNRWLREHPHTPVMSRELRPRYRGEVETRAARHSAGTNGTPDDTNWHVADGTSAPAGSRQITGVTNIVFMGMGEPLVNYKPLWSAIRTLTSPGGMGMGARRLTVSTVGVAPQIRRFAEEVLPVNLAVSLHASNDELRGSMMPINNRYPLDALIAACRDYTERTHRRITFEYVLINGTNDSPELARELAALLDGLLCHVNLIPLNPVPDTGMLATPRERVFAFQQVLERAGISATVRIERGVDIAAACGQLKVDEEPGSKRRSLNPEMVQAHVLADLASAESHSGAG